MSKKNKNKPRKIRRASLSNKLYRSMSIIISIAVLLIVLLMYFGLDKIYLVKSAVEEFVIADDISTRIENEDKDFIKILDKIELDYTVGIEIFQTSSDDLIYSTYYKGEQIAPFEENITPIDPGIRKHFTVLDDAGRMSHQNHFEDQVDESDEKNVNYLVYYKYLPNVDMTIKIIRQRSTADSNARLAVGFVLFIAVAVVILVMFVMSRFLRKTVKPLEKITDVASQISRLDFSQKCDPSEITEINELSTSINKMSDSLEEMIDFLAKQNEKLQEDIEQEKTIDQLRRTFISGISHELKTPIAIISGYAEGVQMYLENGNEEKAVKYCNVIVDETGRMNDLVQRLLELIKYDSGDYEPCDEQFPIYNTIEEWFTRNSKILKEKNITVVNDIDPNLIVSSDSFMVSSVVNNYLSNAVSHCETVEIPSTDENDKNTYSVKRITAYSEKKDDSIYKIAIRNTGKPIQQKDIDKIWDSFYRADKSLSRSQGRFGLGLAIVASIQKIYNLGYGVENKDDGVEFYFEIKVGENDEGKAD